MSTTSRSRQEIHVGLMVIAALVLLIAGLLYLQEIRVRRESQQILVHLNSVGGLSAGDPVHVRGIPLGKVGRIELQDKGVLVVCEIDRRVAIREDASFHVSSVGLVGDRILSLDPGTGEKISSTQDRIFQGSYDYSMPELAGQMAGLGQRFDEFLDRLETTMDSLDADGGLASTLHQTTRAVQGLADFLEENRSQLNTTVANVASLTGQIDTFLSAHGDSLGRAIDRFPATLDRTDSLLVQLDAVAANTQRLLDAINEQEGTVGTLIHDREMAEEMKDSIRQMHALVEDIRRNPQRYLNLTVMKF